MDIRTATIDDLKGIIHLIDNEFTKEGFGFVNRNQVETEIRKHRVLIACQQNNIVGVRIGIDTLWNLVVTNSVRGQGIGKALVNHIRPTTIRVKAIPVGHLSKEQKNNFKDPTAFYEKLGFEYWSNKYPKNFWQRGKDGKGQFHKQGKLAHIKIYKEKNSTLF